AKGEWAIKYLDGGDTSFSTRLGYIGVTHDQAGRLVAGTQWSPYYDVAGVADKPIAFGNAFLYDNHYNLGSARAEKMVSYRNTLSVSEDVAFNIGLGWQGKQEAIYDTRGQIAISTEFAGFGLGYVYNGGDIELGGKKEKSESHVVAAKFGNYGKGLYAALVYGSNEYFYDDLAETKQYEALLAYGLDNGLNISVNYEEVEDDKTNKTQFSQSAVQFEYTVVSGLVAFAAYQFDLGNDIGDKENDQYTVGARYFF
ncbi:MAG TPA: porin, partial [Vibrio sp.]|nr:porin [Vibrio sp.]